LSQLTTMKRVGWACLVISALAAPAAEAQQDRWTDKAFVNVSGGAQTGSHTLTTASVFDIYGEQGTVGTSQKVKGGGLFDVSAGYRVWDNLALGLGYSWTSNSSGDPVTAAVPDPVFRNRPRSVSATGPDLTHTENALHFFGSWMMPLRPKLDAGISFGPSIFFVKQDVPSALTVTEPGPSISSISTTKSSKTGAGINVGADLTYKVTKRIGAGVLLRYTWGSVPVDTATNDLTVGGFQIAGGLRFRFEKLP
jgi:hypothetical protein